MSVSLAFKGSPKISGATRRRIFEVAEKLNYVPNQAARQLRTGKTDIVGFIVTDLANPFHSMMVKHAESAFNEMGLTLFSGGSNWQEKREFAFAERLIKILLHSSCWTRQESRMSLWTACRISIAVPVSSMIWNSAAG